VLTDVLAVNPQLIVSIALLGALAMGLGGYFGFQAARRWREDRNYQRAVTAAQAGDSRGAVRLAVRADAAWRLHGSAMAVKHYVQDLERLSMIWRLLRREMSSLGTGMDLYDLEQALSRMKKLCSSTDNFGWDGRTMKPDTALAWRQYLQQLTESRRTLRGICEQTLKRPARRPA
jgi:hypothetical protein